MGDVEKNPAKIEQKACEISFFFPRSLSTLSLVSLATHTEKKSHQFEWQEDRSLRLVEH